MELEFDNKLKVVLWYNTKKDLSGELGISRPTLDSRLKGKSKWKKLEIKRINELYRDK